MKRDNQTEAALILRQKAEDMMKKKAYKTGSKLAEIDALKLVHELEVYQIELELQNEELFIAKEKAAELATEKYAELYDFAPSGYFTLSKEGTIIELNLCGSQMLGKERTRLKNYLFSSFVSNETKPIFNQFLTKVFASKAIETCELALSVNGNLPMYVHLTGSITDNGTQCLVIVVDITDINVAEEKLRNSEMFLKETQIIAQLGTYTTDISTGKWLSSEILDHIFGIDSDFDKSVDGWISIIHPDWQQFMNDYFIKDVIGKKTKFDKEYKIIRQNDKQERWVHGMGSLKYGPNKQPVTMVGAILDITDRKLAEQALKESEEKYRFLFANNPQPMWIHDVETHAFLEVNQAAINHYGYSREEFLNMTLKDIRPAEDTPKFVKNIELACQAFNIAGEWRHIKKNGEIINVEIASQSVVYNDRNAKHVLVNDITDRKRAEAEIQFKNEELQRINAEKDKFFSIIAHDLRNPFTGFLGLTEIMAEKLPEMSLEETQNIALVMRTSATNLFRLLGNLLDWSRSQRGLTTYIPSPFLLKPKILENALLSHEAAIKKKITIKYDIPEDLEVVADLNMLGGIIRNLVTNAVKFTPKGGKINVSAKFVPGNLVEVSITDTGIGMSANMIGNLFRLDVNTCRKGTDGEYSTGLGLIICKDSIEKHGGKLCIESEEGKGSTFRFTLPGKIKMK